MRTFNHQIQRHKLDRNGKYSNWTIRRRIIALTLSFCAAMVVWVMTKLSMPVCTLANMVPVDPDVAVKTVIVQSAFFLAGAVIGSYVFGATWEDRKKMDIINDQVDINQDNGQQQPIQNQPPQNPPAPSVNNPDVQAQLNGSN